MMVPPVGIVFGVKNQRGQGIGGVASGRRNALDNGFQNLFNAHAFFGGTFDVGVRIKSQFRINFFQNPVNIG